MTSPSGKNGKQLVTFAAIFFKFHNLVGLVDQCLQATPNLLEIVGSDSAH